MSRTPRSPDEIEAFREEIMSHALDLIVRCGYDGFSMRKLAGRLGIAAKTIYNYFHNKDEIYLCLLIKGFEQLYADFESAITNYKDPLKRLSSTIRAYVDFGLENDNIYNLMFTWHVPKYNDYIGTPMEQVAHTELTTALKCADFFMDRIRACLEDDPAVNEDDIRTEMIQIWSHMHGYIAGINNTLLNYMHEKPMLLKNRVIDRIVKHSLSDLLELKYKTDSKVVSSQGER